MLFRLSLTAKAYWWTERPNFGDALAPLLLNRFANVKSVWKPISHARIASVGSIIEHIPPLWDGYILGSGKLYNDSRVHLHTKTAKILLVRGPLTAYSVPKGYTFGIGDPGILANELVGPQEKQWDLGILPHWQDKQLITKFEALIKPPFTTTVIDPASDPIEILKKIGACRRLVTSSLHGMIAADSFGIPRRVEICEGMLRDGGDFKFRDYSASIQAKWEPGVMFEASRFRVDDVKFAVYDAYRELERLLSKEAPEWPLFT